MNTRIAILTFASLASSSTVFAQVSAEGTPPVGSHSEVESGLAVEPPAAGAMQPRQDHGVQPAATRAPASLTAPDTPPRALAFPTRASQSPGVVVEQPLRAKREQLSVALPPDDGPWQPGSLTAGLTATGLLRNDPFYSLFAESDVWAQIGAFVGFDGLVSEHLRAGGELSWGLSVADDRGTEGAGDRSLAEHRVLASGLLAIPLCEALWPHMRVGAGAVMSKVHLELDQNQFLIDQWRVVPLLELALGATYHVPITQRGRALGLAIGVRVEAGYAITGTRELNQEVSKDQRVKTRYAELGSLQPGGAFARLAVLLRI